MSISSLTSSSYGSLSILYNSLASGKRINSAADDAAGLSVATSLKTQTTGYTQEVKNAKDTQNMLNIEDGSLSTLTDSLQRMRELSLQAANSYYGTTEKDAIQSEISQLKDFIGTDKLESLGLTDYNVTGNPSISDLDSAIRAVSSERGTIGAESNTLDHEMNYTANAAENLTASQSQIEDLDYAQALTQLSTEQTMFQTRLLLQSMQMNGESGRSSQLLGLMGA